MRRFYRPDVPAEIKIEGVKAFQKRARTLRKYIDELTVKPINPLEVLHAMAHDLTEIANVYGGDFNKACGEKSTGVARLSDDERREKLSSEASERSGA